MANPQVLTPSTSLYPLQTYIDRIQEIFRQALDNDNPALLLYRHNARSPLFMAESIARLLDSVSGSEKTARALRLFKRLEDSLGKIDDYDQLVQQFSEIGGVKKKQLGYFINKRDKELERLNKKLLKKDFYLQRFQELYLDLKIDFNNAALVTKLENSIRIELKSAVEFYKSCAGNLTDMQGQVHEIRRKLRWMSIYAQSLQGIIVLKPASKKYTWEKKFITPRELDSPYVHVAVKRDLHRHIFFNQKAFYALDFVISELGTIKDKGLAMEAFAKMLKKTSDPANPMAQTRMQLKLKDSQEDLLEKADHLLKEFLISSAIHEKLLKP